MNSYERKLGRRFEEDRTGNAISANLRPPFTRGRRLEASVDIQQQQGVSMKVIDATEPLPFVFGGSRFGGPDVFA